MKDRLYEKYKDLMKRYVDWENTEPVPEFLELLKQAISEAREDERANYREPEELFERAIKDERRKTAEEIFEDLKKMRSLGGLDGDVGYYFDRKIMDLKKKYLGGKK